MNRLAAIFQPCIPSCCSRVTTAVALSESFMIYFLFGKESDGPWVGGTPLNISQR